MLLLRIAMLRSDLLTLNHLVSGWAGVETWYLIKSSILTTPDHRPSLKSASICSPHMEEIIDFGISELI